MTWVKLDDGFYDNPKVLAAGGAAVSLYIAALCWSAQNLTDGQVPRTVIPVLCKKCGINRAKVQHLLRTGLFRERDDFYVINDYLDYQPSRADVQAKRQKWAEHKAKARAVSTAESTAESTADSEECPRTPTRPVVSYLHPPTTDSRSEPAAGDRAEKIVEALVALERQASNGSVRNPAAWTRTVRARIETEHGLRITELANRYPTAPDSVIVAAVLGDTHSLRYYQENP